LGKFKCYYGTYELRSSTDPFLFKMGSLHATKRCMLTSLIRWLWSRVVLTPIHAATHFWLFHLRSHFRCHHALVWCSRSCLDRVAISFFVLNSFQILLVFNFLFNVLISLQQFIVFLFSDLQSSIQITLKLLL